MTVLKGILNVLLAILLLAALALAGLAVSVEFTALNAGFINRHIESFDVPAFFDAEILPELQQNPELIDYPGVIMSIRIAVHDNTPAFKSALQTIVSDVYAYLSGDKRPFDLRYTLNNSLFEPSMTLAIIDDVDLTPFIHDLMLDALPDTSMEIALVKVDLLPYSDDVIGAIQPWFKVQAGTLMLKIYEYLLGYDSAFEFEIDAGGIDGDIGQALKSALLDSPPAGLAGLTGAQLSQAFDVAWQPLAAQFPAAFTLDLSEIGLARPAEIDEALDNAQHSLVDARRIIGYYRQALWGLVALIIILVAVIVLLNRNFKDSSRVLGVTTALYGLTELTGYAVARSFIHGRALETADIPSALQAWLVQLIDATLVPLFIFSIGCLVVGSVLIILSWWHRRTSVEDHFPVVS